MNDIEKYALDPLDKMRKSISEISNKPFQALKRIASNRFSSKVTDEAMQQDTGEEDDLASLNLETKILEEVIMRVTTLVTIGIGELGPETITNRLTVVDSATQSSAPPLCEDAKGIAAVMLYIRLGFHRKLCRKLTERPN